MNIKVQTNMKRRTENSDVRRIIFALIENETEY
jgi:hypothetical protein